MKTKRFRWLAVFATVMTMFVATACAQEATPTPLPSQTTSAPRGTIEIKVGTLLPMTGPQADQGASSLAAIRLATQHVNDANLGVRVELVTADSGSSNNDIALQGAKELIEAGVTAVIGPRSSSKALQTYEAFRDARIPQISPAATLPSLSEIDSEGYFFRTAPSDSVQAQVLARRIFFDGAASVAVISMSDPYSEALSNEAVAVLRAAGVEVAMHRPASGQSPQTAAQQIAASAPDAVLIVSGAVDFPAIVEQLEAVNIDWSKVYGTDATVELLQDNRTASQLEGAVFSSAGVLADRDLRRGMLSIDPSVTFFAYAPESYDALMLIALAALEAQSTDGAKVSSHITAVSGPTGEIANSFAEAAVLINGGHQVDYSGISGPIDFDDLGNLTGAFISFYRYGANNHVNWLDQSFWQAD
jgi:branched-chain amino acid transport system substrate-binding protein